MSLSLWVVDTNVLIAGIISSNTASPVVKLVDAMLRGEVVYLLSPELLDEYHRVIRRPRLRKAHGLDDDELDQILSEIVANSIWCSTGSGECAPDPGDDHLWNLLRSRDRAVLVTGDRLLLENPPDFARVLSPADWAAWFSRSERA